MKKNTLLLILIKIFSKHGLSKKHSKICAEYLIKAEILNFKSHGLSRLKMYCDRLSKNLINPKPNIKIKKISSSISYLDADNSIGFVAADIGIKQAIKNAKKTGIGLVAIKKVDTMAYQVFMRNKRLKINFWCSVLLMLLQQ